MRQHTVNKRVFLIILHRNWNSLFSLDMICLRMLTNSFKAGIKKNLWMLQNSFITQRFYKKVCVATIVYPEHLLFAIWESLGTYKQTSFLLNFHSLKWSAWPKLHFHIRPKPKAEDWKIFSLWPNKTKPKTKYLE